MVDESKVDHNITLKCCYASYIIVESVTFNFFLKLEMGLETRLTGMHRVMQAGQYSLLGLD